MVNEAEFPSAPSSRPWSAPQATHCGYETVTTSLPQQTPLPALTKVHCFGSPTEKGSDPGTVSSCLCNVTASGGAVLQVQTPEKDNVNTVAVAVTLPESGLVSVAVQDSASGVMVVFVGKVRAGHLQDAVGSSAVLPSGRLIELRGEPHGECLLVFTKTYQQSVHETSLPTLTCDEMNRMRAKNSDYVAFFRKQLQKSQQFALLREESVHMIHCFWQKEEQRRYGILFEEIAAYEEVLRAIYIDIDVLERNAYKKVRYERTYLPWCNLGCKYCCKLQHELYQQVCQMASREVQILVNAEQSASDDIISREALYWERIQHNAWSGALQQNMFLAGRNLLDKKCRAIRLTVTLEEQRAYLDLVHSMHSGHEAARFHDDSWTLKNQHLELCRLQDLLQLREESVSQKMTQIHESTETCQRQALRSDEDTAWTEVLLHASSSQVTLASLKNESKLLDLQTQVESLATYKADREAEETDMQQKKLEEEQAMLIAELDVIKGRLKKNKKAQAKVVLPQSVLQSEQCERCRAKVTKQTYFRHVDKECPYRPVECKMCMLVMRAHELTDHMEVQCLVRTVVCEECNGAYQARYIEYHVPLCSKIIKAQALVPTLRPHLGAETVEGGGEGLLVTAVKSGGSLDGSVKEGDLLVRVGQYPVKSKADLEHVLSRLTPGDSFEVMVLPSSKADGPWWGGDAEEVSSYITFTATIQTTIPLTEYLEMVWLLDEDGKRYGDPSLDQSTS